MENSVTHLHFKPMALNDLDWTGDMDALVSKLVSDATLETRNTNSRKRKDYEPKKNLTKKGPKQGAGSTE